MIVRSVIDVTEMMLKGYHFGVPNVLNLTKVYQFQQVQDICKSQDLNEPIVLEMRLRNYPPLENERISLWIERDMTLFYEKMPIECIFELIDEITKQTVLPDIKPFKYILYPDSQYVIRLEIPKISKKTLGNDKKKMSVIASPEPNKTAAIRYGFNKMKMERFGVTCGDKCIGSNFYNSFYFETKKAYTKANQKSFDDLKANLDKNWHLGFSFSYCYICNKEFYDSMGLEIHSFIHVPVLANRFLTLRRTFMGRLPF